MEIGDIYIDCDDTLNVCHSINNDHVTGIRLYSTNTNPFTGCDIRLCGLEILNKKEIPFAIWLSGRLYDQSNYPRYFSYETLVYILNNEETITIYLEDEDYGFKSYVINTLKLLKENPLELYQNIKYYKVLEKFFNKHIRFDVEVDTSSELIDKCEIKVIVKEILI